MIRQLLHKNIQLFPNRSYSNRVKLSMSTIFGDLRDVPKSIIHLDRDLAYVNESYQQCIRSILLILRQLAAALVQVWGVFEPRSVADKTG